jgi:hypothetical protein
MTVNNSKGLYLQLSALQTVNITDRSLASFWNILNLTVVYSMSSIKTVEFRSFRWTRLGALGRAL